VGRGRGSVVRRCAIAAATAALTLASTAVAQTGAFTVTITDGPAGTVSATDASFAFTAENAAGSVRFECSIDGAPAQACSSPVRYSSLAPGAHVFVVAGSDSATGDRSEAQRQWTVAELPAPAPAAGPALPPQEPPEARPPPAPPFLHIEWGPAPPISLDPSQVLPVAATPPDDEGFVEEDAADAVPVRRAPRGFRGDRERSFPANPVIAKAAVSSPSPSLRFLVDSGPPDALLAVGDHYLLAGNTGVFGFYDKQQQNDQAGTLLPSLPGGVDTSMSFNEFFGGFVAPTTSDGSVNQDNINRYLGLGPDPPLGCDPTKLPAPAPGVGTLPTDSCVNTFYDARVYFDAVHKRFVVVAHARNTIWQVTEADHDELADKGYDDAEIAKMIEWAPLARRYLVFAVSNTEDPRGGWQQYISTDSNYVDWPLAAISKHLLLMGHKGAPEDANKPALTVVSLDAIEQGQDDPPFYLLDQAAFGGQGYPAPALGYGNTHGLAWLLNNAAPAGGPLRIFAVPDIAPQPGDPSLPGALKVLETKATLTPPITGSLRVPPVYRDGKLHIGSTVLRQAATDNAPARNNVRPTAIPVTTKSLGITASTKKSEGFRDLGLGFGRNAPEDDPADIVSYELPTLTANDDGDMLAVYGRLGVTTETPLKLEARYSLWYHDEKLPRRSAVLKAGQGSVPAFGQVDFISAAVDPTDGKTFWVSGVYAKSSTSVGVVIGKVRPVRRRLTEAGRRPTVVP